VTVNEELQINSSDLAMMTDELEAVLRNIGAPVLVVDTALQLSRASCGPLQRMYHAWQSSYDQCPNRRQPIYVKLYTVFRLPR